MRAFSRKAPHLYTDTAPKLFSLLCELFNSPRRPPSHALAFQVLDFVQTRSLTESIPQSEFPSMKQDFKIHKNLTLMHFALITERFQYQETREAEKQAQRFYDILQKYGIQHYLDIVEHLLDVPIDQFEAELVEMIVNDFYSLEKSISCYIYSRPFLVIQGMNFNSIQHFLLQQNLNSHVFQNRIDPRSPQVSLLNNYVVKAVKNSQKEYLEGLSYEEFTEDPVQWEEVLLNC